VYGQLKEEDIMLEEEIYAPDSSDSINFLQFEEAGIDSIKKSPVQPESTAMMMTNQENSGNRKSWVTNWETILHYSDPW